MTDNEIKIKLQELRENGVPAALVDVLAYLAEQIAEATKKPLITVDMVALDKAQRTPNVKTISQDEFEELINCEKWRYGPMQFRYTPEGFVEIGGQKYLVHPRAEGERHDGQCETKQGLTHVNEEDHPTC